MLLQCDCAHIPASWTQKKTSLHFYNALCFGLACLTQGIDLIGANDKREKKMKNKILLVLGLALFAMPLWAAEDAGSPATAAPTMEKPMPAASAPAAEDKSGFSRGSVVRSAFTTGIKDHQPVDDLKTISTDQKKVYYYTELRDMSGQTATHRWEYNGKVMAEVKFNVRGPRWRVWSTKTMLPGWTGDWKVSVINGAGEVISEDVFKYEAATPAATPDTMPAKQEAPAAPTMQ